MGTKPVTKPGNSKNRISKPEKPYSGFPLFASANGQWAKKVKGRLYYFGTWKADPKGEAAMKDWDARREGILAGLDGLRAAPTKAVATLGSLGALYLEDKRQRMLSHTLSPRTYRDLLVEIPAFVSKAGPNAEVAAMGPSYFAAYGKALIERGLGRCAQRRVITYIRGLFHWGAKNGYSTLPIFGTGFVAPSISPDAMRQARIKAGQADNSRRIVTGPEVTKLLDVANPQFKAIILVALNCGLGPADLGRLRWHHLDMKTGVFEMPRGKTGTARQNYLWAKTRKALARVAKLKQQRAAIEREGRNALVFISRTGRPMAHESEIIADGVSAGVRISNAITRTFARLLRKADLKNLSGIYRLRHTMKTLGKAARDPDALDLMMGHADRTTGAFYDHEQIEPARIRRVSLVIKHALWPDPKRHNKTVPQVATPRMRIAG